MSARRATDDVAAFLEGVRSAAAAALQFGEAPAGLAPLQREIGDKDRDAIDYVAGMLQNAEAAGARDPGAAMCFHEAGRALERRLGRPVEAWCCYHRAIETARSYPVSLLGLARLARAAGDSAALRRVLERAIEEIGDAATCAALAVEKAAREIMDGDFGDAVDTVRTGLVRAPEATALRALALGLAGATGDDGDLGEALEALSGGCREPALEAALDLALAAVEERRGRLDEAAVWARKAAGAGAGSTAAAWSLVRLALKAGDAVAAAAALRALEGAAGSEELKTACARLRLGLRVCAESFQRGDAGDGGAARDAASTWDLALLEALRAGDGGDEAAAARIGRGEIAPGWLADALEESELLGGGSAGLAESRAPEAAMGSSRRKAIAALLRPDDREDADGLIAALDEAPALALHAALASGRPEIAAQALAVLGADPANAEAAHEIAAARAALQRNALRDPAAALETLGAASPTRATPPLASLVRLHRRDAVALAEVALAEAGAAGSARARSWSVAWAARHLADTDRDRAEELYCEALRANPTCGLALHALERNDGNHAETARAWLAAAGACAGEDAKCAHLIKAGIHFAIGGEVVRAGQALGAAARIADSEKGLGIIARRLAADGAEEGGLEANDLDLSPGDDVCADDVLGVAAASLRRDPLLALRGFGWLRGAAPGDPLAERGVVEAQLASGRWSEVSGGLFERLRTAATPDAEASLYARLAEMDEHFGKNRSSAIVSLMEIALRLPGQRTTLALLALHFAGQEREEDLAATLLDLARAVEDDRDGAAAAAAAFRLAPLSMEAVRAFADRSPGSVYAAAELEARAETPVERLACLRRLTGGQPVAAVNVSRLADALEDAGVADEALAARTRAVELSPESIAELLGLERLQRAAGDSAGLLWTMRRIAELTAIAERRHACLLEGARLAADAVGDPLLAGQLALAVLTEDTRNDEAYQIARRLSSSIPDPAFADAVIEARIGGREDPAESRELLIELAELRERRGDAEGAKDALERIVALFPADVDTRRALSGLRQRDREWPEAIAHLLEAARYTQDDPAVGIGLFYELGTLYQQHSDRPDLAEKCYVKVLGWDRGHWDAMERLSEVYAAAQNWPRAGQALEHLVGMTTDPVTRTEKTVLLAEVLDRHLNRKREAEQMLNDARRAAPLDIRPVEALAAIYTGQRDALALNVLLDQALVNNAAAVGDAPGDPTLYANLLAIMTMKGDDDLAAMAETALVLLGAEIPERYRTNRAEPWWNVGARVGEGIIDDFLCPKEVTPGFRGTLAVVEEAVAKHLGLGAKQVAAASATRLDKRHPLAQVVAQYAPTFGLRGEPAVLVDEIREIRVAPGAPPAVVVPRELATAQDEAVLRFAAAAALGLYRMGLSLATLMSDEQLRLLAACCIKMSVPSLEIGGVDPRALGQEIERLRPVISGKLIDRIQPLAFDCGEALAHQRLRDSVAAVGHRAGFVAAGTLSAGINALRAIAGRNGAPLDQVPGLARLMSFVFSKLHIELRQRMGI